MIDNWIVVMEGEKPLIAAQRETVEAVVKEAMQWLSYDDDSIVVAVCYEAFNSLVAALGEAISEAEDVRDVRRYASAILALSHHDGWFSEWTDGEEDEDGDCVVSPVLLFNGVCTSVDYDVQCRIEGALMRAFNLSW
jgi:hypothetical protein